MDVATIHHPRPLLSEADGLITVTVAEGSKITHEVLHAESLGEDFYRVCSIPVFAHDIAFRDVVYAPLRTFERVSEWSGRYVFRIWSEEGWLHKFDALQKIAEAGGHIEECTARLTGVDVPDLQTAQKMRELLNELEEQGLLVYETGWS